MEKTGQYYLRKEVNFIFQKKEYNSFISPKTDFELLTKTLKKTFHLQTHFVLKYRTYDNSFATIKDQAGLMDYIKQKLYAYTIYVQHDDKPKVSSDELVKATPYYQDAPKKYENKDSICFFRKFQKADDSRGLNSSSWSNADLNSPDGHSPSKGRSEAAYKNPQSNFESWGIKKSNKRKAKPVYPPKPQPAPTAFVPKSEAAKHAQEIQKIATKYQTALESHPSLLLTSQLLLDQILHGVNINFEVLKKTLHRRAISDSFSTNCSARQTSNESVANLQPATSSLAFEEPEITYPGDYWNAEVKQHPEDTWNTVVEQPETKCPEDKWNGEVKQQLAAIYTEDKCNNEVEQPQAMYPEVKWNTEVGHLAAEIEAFGIPMDD